MKWIAIKIKYKPDVETVLPEGSIELINEASSRQHLEEYIKENYGEASFFSFEDYLTILYYPHFEIQVLPYLLRQSLREFGL